MEKAYKLRIYPNKKQKEQISKTFGCVRFVYNYYLDKHNKTYKEEHKILNYYDYQKDLTFLKKEKEFLYEIDNRALQNSLRDLSFAFKKFFKEHKGYPKFKSKKTHKNSYRTSYTNNNIEYLGKYIKIPKLGLVRTKGKINPSGRILNATISKTPTNKYFVSLCYTDVDIKPFLKTNENIGIDLGIRNYAILSNGDKIYNPKYLEKLLKNLAKKQRQLSRKSRGSKNFEKTRIKVALAYEKIVNQRKDYLQKLSIKLIKEYDVLSVETLDIKQLIKENKYIRNKLTDVSWYEFVRCLEYKAKWYGKTLIKVDKNFASSKICSNCGHVEEALSNPSIYKWKCPNCNTYHDRDINAAINIKNEGLRLLAV